MRTTASKKLPSGRSLFAEAPTVALEWNVSRNSPISSADVHVGSPNKAWWVCGEGHEWFATIRDRVRKNAGCPFCAGKRATPENCVGISERARSLWHPTRNLPKTPWTITAGSEQKLWWRCTRSHEWRATPNNVIGRGSGCPRCVDQRDSKREQECRLVLETLTGCRFPKSKPSWLQSDLGRQMEFDGYSAILNVAFEHHGIQHYEFTPFFHRGQKFKRTQELDAEKRRKCAIHGTRLIEVRWDCADLVGFIRARLSATQEVRLCGT